MANVLADDLDNTVSTDDTPVLTWQFSFGPANKQTTYEIDLTEANYTKLEDALRPFINAGRTPETNSTSRTRSVRAAAAAKPSQDTKAIREWAQKNNVTFPGADGKPKKVGDKGRLHESVIAAWEAREDAS